ncbi:glycosyltransferase involved in cell wall biosynthesis [Ruminiclostridium sufflavum DSM 19573]|uniref:Glycosyltransferase involved in cell wall biosynthesis n=1 Tax=Ruminiclostridium sufflavum DSM 19573 TaxID=1121337 RepID=A0A318Y5A9_9FIRM|nr:glycosyltransferase [Ruminiclostridium sufflavum]PYG87171.1 glycosyltransferase involved in cell wall biosynthesis [Ruminiclostridium sufflavum DSM 19573]
MEKAIMIVTNRYDPDVRVHKEAKYLRSKGFDVEVLCWDREGEYINKSNEKIDGIVIRRFFPYAKYGTGIKQLIAYIKFIIEIKKYLSKVEYSYLHCHDLDGIIAGFFLNKEKAKLIFDMHEFYEVLWKNQKLRYIIRSIVSFFQNKSDAIIYVNEEQMKVTKQKYRLKSFYLPNYPDEEYFKDIKKSYSDSLRIAYIGAVRQSFELKNLMDACKDLKNVEVIIHGMGVAYKYLRSIEANYNNVKVTGTYSVFQIGELYRNTDILYVVYPMDTAQNRLAFPVKFYEAILTKTPVIVSKGSVIEEFVKEHNIGLSVDGNNTEDILKCINNIVKNRDILDLQTKNISKIQFWYTWNKVINHLDKIYNIG